MIRNLPIRSKLIGILIAPLVALTLLTSLGIGANLATKVQAEDLRQEAAFATTLSRLVHELQHERDLSAGWVSGGRADDGRRDLDDQQARVNRALEALRKDAQALKDDGSSFYGKVQTSLNGFSRLAEVRQSVEDDSAATSAQQVLDSYSKLIGNLLAVDFEIARTADNHTLTRNVAAFVAMARLKEAASQERGLLHAVTAAGKFAPGEAQRLSALAGSQESWRSQFNAAATPEQHQALDQTLERADSEQATQLRDDVLGIGPFQLATTAPSQPTTISPADWFRASTARIELLRGMEEDLLGDVDATAAAVQAGGSRRALIYTVILTALLWLTVGLVLLMATSMVRPLRTLTRTANEVADVRLPGLVEQLQQAKDPRELDVVPEPVPVDSTDEIGQVSAAFNSVHSTAIQVATEQAALRRSIGDMFLNLARRSQTLIDRQLELMDDLEREETDPQTLENLFKLDHLATRMRRNSEDLIVLSGEAPPRRWTQPLPLLEVVRAAVAEVEDYQRVELLPIDETTGLAGHAVSDVVHLLAELIENATSFSAPGTKVQIAGQHISSGYVLEIEDRGLGMSDEELVEANERLANPPIVDFALSRMLGLYVVARLAQRYNIKVQLRHSWYGGITALVLLPPSLTVQAPVPESLEAPARNGHQRPELTAPALPGPDAFPGQAAPPPSSQDTGDGQSGDQHLPIFEAARSDWFDEEDVHRDHLPLRRHGAEQQPRTTPEAAWWDRGAGPGQPSAGAADLREHPLPTSPPPPASSTPPAPPAPPAPARQLRADQPPPAASSPPAPPAPPASATPLTSAGLPRRVPRTNLAPGMVAMQADQEPPPVSPEPPPAPDIPTAGRGRSPEEVRSMLSSYRSGVERGRTRSGDPDPDALRSSRSDDDPTQ
jgi:hypothetical protein